MTIETDSRETQSGDRNNEPISALVDGELDPKGAAFLIRRLADDQHMHHQWQRFHMVRACLQREFTGPVSLVARIDAALQDEATPQRAGRLSSLVRLGVGGAVAASVAMVAVLGLANRMDSGDSAAPQRIEDPGFVSQSTALDRQFNAPLVPAGFGPNQDSVNHHGSSSPANQRINRYMIRHSQAAGSNGFISLTPVLAAPAAVQPVAEGPADDASDRANENR